MPLLRIIAILVITLLGSVVAFSSCMLEVPASPARDFVNAQAVFRGRVTKVGFNWFGRRAAPVTFEVERSWKGLDSNQVVVYTGPVEGYSFEPGETYIVYASRDNGTFYTSNCSATSMVRDAATQLKDLSGRSPIPISEHVSNAKAKVVTITGVTVLLLIGIGYAVHRFVKHAA
jgi:hypothetical protein